MYSFREWLLFLELEDISQILANPEQSRFYFDPGDKQQRLGDDKTNPLKKIDDYINNMLDAWKDWKSSPTSISPSSGGGFTGMADIAVVMTGQKPVAWTIIEPGSLKELIVKRAMQRGNNGDPRIVRDLTMAKPWSNDKHWLIGNEKNIRELVPLLKRERKILQASDKSESDPTDRPIQYSPPVPIALQKKIGRLLGYDSEGSQGYYDAITQMFSQNVKGYPDPRKFPDRTAYEKAVQKRYKAGKIDKWAQYLAARQEKLNAEKNLPDFE
jgi:hypothetical protein